MLDLDTLTPNQRQNLVNAMIHDVMAELMEDSLLKAFSSGRPPVDTTFRRSPCAMPHPQRPGEWTIERRLLEMPGRMTIDAEYEVVV